MLDLEDLSFKVKELVTKNQKNNSGVELSDAVCRIQWAAEYTDGDDLAEFIGATQFEVSDISETEFMKFDSLDENTVIGWIKNTIDDMLLEHMSGMLLKKIERNKETAKELPWKPTKEEANDPDQ